MGIIISTIFDTSLHRVVLLGLDGAGKTTVLYRLKWQEIVLPPPTVGFNCEKVEAALIHLISLVPTKTRLSPGQWVRFLGCRGPRSCPSFMAGLLAPSVGYIVCGRLERLGPIRRGKDRNRRGRTDEGVFPTRSNYFSGKQTGQD